MEQYDKKHLQIIENSFQKSSARFRDGCKFLLKCEMEAIESATAKNKALNEEAALASNIAAVEYLYNKNITQTKKVLDQQSNSKIDTTSQFHGARKLRDKINVNQHALSMFPKKAIEQLINVQEKRFTMTQEMTKMGIGRQYANVSQLAKFKEKRQQSSQSPRRSTSLTSSQKDAGSRNTQHPRVQTSNLMTGGEHSRANPSLHPQSEETKHLLLGSTSRLGTSFKDYRHQNSISQMQKNLHRFERNLAIQEAKQRTRTPIISREHVFEQRKKQKRLKTVVQQQFAQEQMLAKQANNGNVGGFFQKMLQVPHNATQRQPMFAATRTLSPQVDELKILGSQQPIYGLTKQQLKQMQGQRPQRGCYYRDANNQQMSSSKDRNIMNRGTSTGGIEQAACNTNTHTANTNIGLTENSVCDDTTSQVFTRTRVRCATNQKSFVVKSPVQSLHLATHKSATQASVSLKIDEHGGDGREVVDKNNGNGDDEDKEGDQRNQQSQPASFKNAASSLNHPRNYTNHRSVTSKSFKSNQDLGTVINDC